MKTPTKTLQKRHVGRPEAFRKPVTVRVKEEILARLGPAAAAKIRELVESTYG